LAIDFFNFILKTMRDFIKKYEIWIFLVLAPVINTIIVYAKSEGFLHRLVYRHGRFFALFLLLIFIVKFTKGNEGIKDVFKPMLKWKVKPKWYLFSLIFAATIAVFTLLLKAFYYGSEYSTFLKFNHNYPLLRGGFILLIWAFVGEVVWVSYCVRELSKIMKPFYASQIVGFVWTMWWVPVVFLNEGVILDLPLWPLLLHMMGAAGMCAFVYLKTGSGICVWILQFCMNLFGILLPVSPVSGGVPTYSTFAILYFITMLVFMYFMMNPIRNFKLLKKV
jgi:hypothetical protein